MGSTTLPGATPAQAYSAPLSVTGGTAPYTWSITSGQLPSGLSISASTGLISGTPAASGTFSFAVTVKDSASPAQTASASTSIVVGAIPLTLTTPTLPSGTSGTSYSQSLHASGGTGSYTWSVTSGSLPAGLSLASTTGVISGTPAVNGTFSFAVTVKDSASPAQTASASTSIVVGAIPLTLTAPILPSGTSGSPYSQALQASGGTGWLYVVRHRGQPACWTDPGRFHWRDLGNTDRSRKL